MIPAEILKGANFEEDAGPAGGEVKKKKILWHHHVINSLALKFLLESKRPKASAKSVHRKVKVTKKK